MTDLTVTYREILGFPGYRVGDDGSVWSCRHKSGLLPRWRQLRGGITIWGYVQVVLCCDKKKTTRTVHSLVLEAFIGPCPQGMEGCHEDRNKTNNRVGNLRWDTHAENLADRVRHGTVIQGEKQPFAKLTEKDVRSIRHLSAEGLSSIKIVENLNLPVDSCAVRRIIRGETWKHLV